MSEQFTEHEVPFPLLAIRQTSSVGQCSSRAPFARQHGWHIGSQEHRGAREIHITLPTFPRSGIPSRGYDDDDYDRRRQRRRRRRRTNDDDDDDDDER